MILFSSTRSLAERIRHVFNNQFHLSAEAANKELAARNHSRKLSWNAA